MVFVSEMAYAACSAGQHVKNECHAQRTQIHGGKGLLGPYDSTLNAICDYIPDIDGLR